MAPVANLEGAPVIYETEVRIDVGFDPQHMRQFEAHHARYRLVIEYEVTMLGGYQCVEVKSTQRRIDNADELYDVNWFWDVCPDQFSRELDREMLKAWNEAKARTRKPKAESW
jgi:hypothetical protein